MLPELTLTLLLIVAFIADFATAGKERKWLHPAMCLLLAAHTAVNFPTGAPAELFGGMYVSTPATGVIKTILAAATLVVLIQSRGWLGRKDTAGRQGEFYMLLFATLLGMDLMVSAGHFLTFFLGLETASVPMACLVAFDKHSRKSAEAGAKFILTAVFSSGVMLYGLSFMYAQAGTLYFGDFAGAVEATPLSVLGMVFFFSGLGFKLSLVPFHFWTADSYQGAPTNVAAYLSVVSKGAAAFAACTILVKVLAPMSSEWMPMLYMLVAATITIGNLFAIRQSDIKRFMAFSSVSQAGYIMLAVVGNSAAGSAALVYYILIYAAANLAVFAIISAVEENNGGRTEISDYDGLYSTNPKLAFIMTLALFSLGGIPPFAGMFSKFFVFMAAAEQGSAMAYAVVFIALVNTVVSLYYYLLIVKAMYIRTAATPLPAFKSDGGTRLALAISTAGVALLGVVSAVYHWVEAAM